MAVALLFLCAAALLASGHVLPPKTELEDKPAVQLLAKRDPAKVAGWAQIKKLSERLQTAREKNNKLKKSQLVKPLPASLVIPPTGESTRTPSRRDLHKRSTSACDSAKPPTTNTHTLAYGDELDVRWVGEPYEDHLLILVVDASPLNLYFSQDGGASFALAVNVTEPIRDVFISEANASVIYAISAVKKTGSTYLLFVSLDGGATFAALTVSHDFSTLKLHPTRPDRFLGLEPDEIGYSDNDDGTIDVSTVYAYENVTHIAAQATATNQPALHGVIVDNQVMAVDFFRPSPEMMKCRASTVYYTKFVDEAAENTQATFKRSEHPYGLLAPETLLTDAFDYEQVHQYVFVTQYLGDAAEGVLQLQVSTDMGVKFNVAKFPFEGEARLFTFVDGTEDLSVVSVQKTVSQQLGNCIVVLQGTAPVNVTAVSADFTPAPNMTAAVQLVGSVSDTACSQDAYTGAKGNVIVVLRGGGCSFFQKVTNAYNAGAVGVIVVNTENEFTVMGVSEDVEETDYPALPAFLVPSGAANTLKSHLGQNVLLVEEEIEEEDLFDTAALYVSGPDGVHYTAALEDVIDFGSLGSNLVDVYKVESSNSTYIANVMLDGKLTTVITFDKGSLWQRLPADCEQQCNLTVALSVSSSMSSIPGPRSAPEAPGLIIVNGYAATTEGFEPELAKVDTFWSKDGGHTWTMALTGAHDYRVLDHGGVVVFVPYGEQTTEIYYSLYPADPQPFHVFTSEQLIMGVVTEPGASTLTAFLFYLSNSKWTGVQLDFSPTLPTLCTPDDFEPFNNLNDGALTSGPGCLDGLAVTYQHRKTCTLCSYGPTFKAQVSTTVCPCSFRDFQCYPGFVRAYPVDNASSICARDIYYSIDGQCAPGQTLFDLPRYRIIPGDVCTPTADQHATLLAPRPLPCHIGTTSRSSSSMSRGLVAFLVLFVLGISSMLVLIFSLVVSPTFRNKFARGIGMGESQACCLSRMLAHLKIFRQQHNYQYSVLQQDEQRDLAHGDSDDDDMLFGIGDAQLVAK
eukprot:m.228255 g.228255  ORF g.228255 m.228255 type:complete len:1021 (-) comp17430_c0_seq1:174-3236(-)